MFVPSHTLYPLFVRPVEILVAIHISAFQNFAHLLLLIIFNYSVTVFLTRM